MTIKYIPADYRETVLIWLSIYGAVMAKAKELGSEDPNTEVVIQYEGIAPGGTYAGQEMVGVTKQDQELGRTGERFFY